MDEGSQMEAERYQVMGVQGVMLVTKAAGSEQRPLQEPEQIPDSVNPREMELFSL